jgi:ArsR family transcriptional regulator
MQACIMETRKAAGVFSALSHEGRLIIFGELMQARPEGLAAGDLAQRMGIAPNTLSARLTILSNADLITSRRAGRSVIYVAKSERMNELIAYLTEEFRQDYTEVRDDRRMRAAEGPWPERSACDGRPSR